jgi:hypothetical protein
MTTLQQIDKYEFWANLYPIIRDPGWGSEIMADGSVSFRREQPFDAPVDYRNRAWVIGIIQDSDSWHYCWAARSNGSSASGRLHIPRDSTPEFAYSSARSMADAWFANETKRMLAVFQPRNLMMEPGEE